MGPRGYAQDYEIRSEVRDCGPEKYLRLDPVTERLLQLQSQATEGQADRSRAYRAESKVDELERSLEKVTEQRDRAKRDSDEYYEQYIEKHRELSSIKRKEQRKKELAKKKAAKAKKGKK